VSITQEQYDKKATELRLKITEQNEILNRFPEAVKNFADLMIKLLNISTRAWEIFQSSSIDKKQEHLGLITLNLTLDDKKLYVELQKPFDAIYNYNKTGKWGHVVDLFRTKLIQSDLNALIESIRLLMQLVNVKLEIY